MKSSLDNFNPHKRRDILKRAVLDCETNESARFSLADIFGISTNDLVTYLKRFRFDENQTWDIFKSLIADLDCTWGFSNTTWFHLTRCLPTSNFEHGILPLPYIIEQTWEFLFKINSFPINILEWNKFRGFIENMNIYKYRSTKKIQHGPYGILIGDLSFNALVGQDHYIKKGPEIVILICNEFKKEFGHSLLNDFISATQACIVKFQTATSELVHLQAALSYVYKLEQSETLSLDNSDCYDGQGNTVLREQIQKVIFLDDSIFNS